MQIRPMLTSVRKFLTFAETIATGGTMITSKLTSKAQTTVPAPVRTALRLKAGDELVYSIERDRVILTKRDDGLADDPFATFDEWSSEVDRRAYGNL